MDVEGAEAPFLLSRLYAALKAPLFHVTTCDRNAHKN